MGYLLLAPQCLLARGVLASALVPDCRNDLEWALVTFEKLVDNRWSFTWFCRIKKISCFISIAMSIWGISIFQWAKYMNTLAIRQQFSLAGNLLSAPGIGPLARIQLYFKMYLMMYWSITYNQWPQFDSHHGANEVFEVRDTPLTTNSHWVNLWMFYICKWENMSALS